jgi:L1 cell adhesion molecule like protein
LDIIPLSLGVEVVGDRVAVVVPRNTTIPCQRTQSFYTAFDNQSSVRFSIYEGERTFTKDCNLIGEFVINGITIAK